MVKVRSLFMQGRMITARITLLFAVMLVVLFCETLVMSVCRVCINSKVSRVAVTGDTCVVSCVVRYFNRLAHNAR